MVSGKPSPVRAACAATVSILCRCKLSRSKNMSKAPQVEVYGFVGYILSFVVFGTFLFFRNTCLLEKASTFSGLTFPSTCYKILGSHTIPTSIPSTLVRYWPLSRYWAIAVPCWTCVAVVYGVIVYVCITFIRNPSLDSKHAYTGICCWC